jgi:hypothetical protein
MQPKNQELHIYSLPSKTYVGTQGSPQRNESDCHYGSHKAITEHLDRVITTPFDILSCKATAICARKCWSLVASANAVFLGQTDGKRQDSHKNCVERPEARSTRTRVDSWTKQAHFCPLCFSSFLLVAANDMTKKT